MSHNQGAASHHINSSDVVHDAEDMLYDKETTDNQSAASSDDENGDGFDLQGPQVA